MTKVESINSSADRTPRRWQLRLSDLVFVALLAGVCGVYLSFALARRFTGDPGTDYPTVAVTRVPGWAYGVGIAMTLAGALPILIAGNRRRWRGVTRWVCAGFCSSVLVFFTATVIADDYAPRRPETVVFEVCRTYSLAQIAYRNVDYNTDGVLEYAQSIGGKFGLGDPRVGFTGGRVSEAFAGEGQKLTPYFGYVFKILKAQGKRAPGGALKYLDENDRMTRGHALMAAPAVYGGPDNYYKTYFVSTDGKTYECDYGEKTPTVFLKTTEFDPEPGWVKIYGRD